MKALKKNDMGVSPVIAVILMVAITVVLAGVVFLWAQSFTDDAEGGVENVNVKGSIDASDDLLAIEVISGTYDWSNYNVLLDGSTTLTEGGNTTSAGGVNYWEGYDFQTSTSYNIKLVNIADNEVVWEDDIIATA